MAVTLSAKERMLLQDQVSHEQLCIQKYQKYANQAKDPQLEQLFGTLAQKEQEHLNTINQILSGQVPNVQQNAQGQNQQMQPNQQPSPTADAGDKLLCQDMLSTEKYVSAAYNTSIFEFADTNIRKVLNHIQKEEQEHGEQIFNYMKANGMYQAQ